MTDANVVYAFHAQTPVPRSYSPLCSAAIPFLVRLLDFDSTGLPSSATILHGSLVHATLPSVDGLCEDNRHP